MAFKNVFWLVAFAFIVPFEAFTQMYRFGGQTVVNARGLGMGNMEVLSPTGADALFSNPANLAIIKGQNFTAGLRFFAGSFTVEANGISNDGSFPLHPKIDHLAYAQPFMIPNSPVNLIGSIGFRTYYDMGFKVKSGDARVSSRGGFNTLSIGAGIQIGDRADLGAALNFGVLGNGKYVEEYQSFKTTTKISYSGSFIQLGFRYHFTPAILIGGMYRPGFRLKQKTRTESGQTQKTTFDLPAIFGLAGQYSVSPQFSIIAELQNRPFEDFEVNGRSYFGNINNGRVVRIGGEYRGAVIWRFGFFSESLLQTDYQDEDPVTLNGFTAGTAFSVEPFTIDLFVQYSQFTVSERSNSETTNRFFKFGMAVSKGQ